MQVLGISSSPRKNGNTDILTMQALDGAAQEGAETTFLALRELNILPCDGCYTCEKRGKCHIGDDMEKVYELMENSQGIVIGSPIYFWSICGQAKVMIDRTFSCRFPKLRLANKVGGAVLAASRRGSINAAQMLNYWMISNHMFPAEVVDGYATKKGDINKDIHAMKASFELGRLIVCMISKGFVYPEEYNQPVYKFVEKKYKVNTCPIP